MIFSIQALIDELAGCDKAKLVYVDNRSPTKLSSYRGYYEDLAIERNSHHVKDLTAPVIDDPGSSFHSEYIGHYQPGTSGVYLPENATVSDLIRALQLALYTDFEGYKGGQFMMEPGSDLWVSEYGDCERLRIAAVEELDDRVDLLTKEVEW